MADADNQQHVEAETPEEEPPVEEPPVKARSEGKTLKRKRMTMKKPAAASPHDKRGEDALCVDLEGGREEVPDNQAQSSGHDDQPRSPGQDHAELRDRLKSRRFFQLWDTLPDAIQQAYNEACLCDMHTCEIAVCYPHTRPSSCVVR